MFASIAEHPRFVPWPIHTVIYKTGILLACAWRHGTCVKTGWPGVNVLWLVEIAAASILMWQKLKLSWQIPPCDTFCKLLACSAFKEIYKLRLTRRWLTWFKQQQLRLWECCELRDSDCCLTRRLLSNGSRSPSLRNFTGSTALTFYWKHSFDHLMAGYELRLLRRWHGPRRKQIKGPQRKRTVRVPSRPRYERIWSLSGPHNEVKFRQQWTHVASSPGSRTGHVNFATERQLWKLTNAKRRN